MTLSVGLLDLREAILVSNTNYPSATPTSFEIFLDHFLIFIALFGVRKGFKMILSHRAPCSLNMSSYRAIWNHFRQNFIFVEPKISDPGPKILILVPKISDPGPKILILVQKNIISWVHQIVF